MARLEQSLGIPTLSGDQPVRVAEYAKRLVFHDDGSRFYSASRQADPWRVARKLLSLRDELVLAGWKGQRPDGESRLSVFAELEEMARDYPLSPGPAERLLRVLSRQGVLPTGIDRIELLDDPEFLPRLWRDVLERMAKAGTQISRRQEVCAEAQGDLGNGQKVLQGKTAGEVRGDGSLLRLESTGVVEAAEAACAYLRCLLKKAPPEAIVLVRDGDPRTALALQNVMRAFDIPSVGLSLDSSHRPATQILPLFVGLAWEPVDPDLLVEFLTLPSSPVPAEARRHLRESLNDAPGYQSHSWKEARQRAIEEIGSKYGADRAAEADREIKQWLDDVKRTPLRNEMAVTDAIRLVAQVESWANLRAHAEEAAKPFFAQAKQQAALMLRLLELHPRPSMSKSEIGRLVLDVLQSGICHELNNKEIDSIRVISGPAAIFGPARHVIWWQCIASSAGVPAPLFWTEDELDFLKRSGCEIPSSTDLLLDHARTWRRPVLCAKKSLLMVQPRQVFGEPAESHPIWNEITATIAVDDAAKAKISVSAAELLNGTVAALDTPLDTIKVIKLSLPAPRQVWQLPPDSVSPPPFASPSSLEKMLGCPLHWVLQYKAGLRKPLIQVLNERQLLYGNFAHWLVGEYLREFIGKELPNPNQTASEIGRRFDALVESEAAPLAKPGMDRERTYVRETLVRATRSLVHLLHQGGYRIASIEETHEGEFLLGEFEGRTDLTVRRASDGKTAVIDLKWSSEGRKRDALKKGTALQLAAYSYLTKVRERWSPTAYFLFPSAQLYSTSEDGFPGSIHITGPCEKDVWEAAMTLTRETKSKLDSGTVEVPGLEEDNGTSGRKQGAEIMDLQAPCEYCNFKLFCSHP